MLTNDMSVEEADMRIRGHLPLGDPLLGRDTDGAYWYPDGHVDGSVFTEGIQLGDVTILYALMPDDRVQRAQGYGEGRWIVSTYRNGQVLASEMTV